MYFGYSAQLSYFRILATSHLVINLSKEAKARIKINKLLEEAGWRFFWL